MSQYYRYCVELIDKGQRVRVAARDLDNKTIYEPGGECGLAEVPTAPIRAGERDATSLTASIDPNSALIVREIVERLGH